MKNLKLILTVLLFVIGLHAQDSQPDCSDKSKLSKEEKKVCKKQKKEEKKLKKISESKFKVESFGCPKKIKLKGKAAEELVAQFLSWEKTHGAAMEDQIIEKGKDGMYINHKKSLFKLYYLRGKNVTVNANEKHYFLSPSNSQLIYNNKKGSYDSLAIEEAIKALVGKRDLDPNALHNNQIVINRAKEAMEIITKMEQDDKKSKSLCELELDVKAKILTSTKSIDKRKKSSKGQVR